MRDNEGEAAEYGIYFDDTNYDYMQHLRDLGDGNGEAHFVDAAPVKLEEGKGKAKIVKLEDALKEATLDDRIQSDDGRDGSIYGDTGTSFSRASRPRTYQDQQDIPDAIAGFQPDMDPRLREVLEALEDDAYVDDKDEEDIFGALTQGGAQEVYLEEFEATLDDEEGWESDVTEKALAQEREVSLPVNVDDSARDEESNPSQADAAATASAEDGDWLRDFAKFKRDASKKAAAVAAESVGAPSGVQAPPTLYTLNGTPLRQKRRKGARTNPSAYSMTSSSLARTEGQQLLDARFQNVEAMYALDEGGEIDDDEDGGISLASGLSKQSKMSTLSTASFAAGDARSDLDGLMDGFLDGWDKGHPGGGKGKGAKGKRGKNGNEALGIQMLDEIRAELGPARIARPQKA
jgi:protein LTV1